MKEIYDDNFLNGQLWIVVDEDRKVVNGEFRFYDELFDDFFTFSAKSKCRKGDNFSENKGIELVKSKLTREYHKMYLNQWAMVERELEMQLKYVKEEKAFREKKVRNIEKDLAEHFDLTYWRKPVKTIKKSTAKSKTSSKK